MEKLRAIQTFVIPAQAGIQERHINPAFAP